MDKEKIIREGIDLNDDQVYYEGDAVGYTDTLYTGIGYELFPNGNLKKVSYFIDGFEYGTSMELYRDGSIKEEIQLLHGQSNGKKMAWYENGKIKSQATYEYGIELEYKEWDQNGTLVIEKAINQEEPKGNYSYLVKMRSLNQGKYEDELQRALRLIADLF